MATIKVNNFLQSKSPKEIKDEILLYPNTYQSIIPLAATGVSPRVFFHWKKMGLINELSSDSSDSRKWVKLNFVEYLWVKFIQALRDLGVGLAEIKEIKDGLLADPFKQYDESLKHMSKEELAKSYPSTNTPENIALTAQMKNIFVLVPPSHRIFISQFGISVNAILTNDSDIDVLIYSVRKSEMRVTTSKKGKRIEEVTESKEMIFFLEGLNKEADKTYSQLYAYPHIRVSIKALFDHFFAEAKNFKYLLESGLINSQEFGLLESVRDGNFKEIIITKKDKKIVMEKVSTEEIRNDKLHELSKTLRLKDYQKITIIKRNNKHAYIENKSLIE